MASREVFEARENLKQNHSKDFLTVGGMGHASQIAAGIAIEQPNRKVLCIDGDGALLMHTGSLAISADCNNLIHVLLNNEAHDSVGGQPTKGSFLKFSNIAQSFGYGTSITVLDLDQLRVINDSQNLTPSFLKFSVTLSLCLSLNSTNSGISCGKFIYVMPL